MIFLFLTLLALFGIWRIYKYYNNGSVSHFTPDKPSETITYYYASWCQFCKEFRTELDAFKKYVADNKLPITVAEVDASDYASLPQETKDKVKGFPTVVQNSTNEVFMGGPSILELFKKLKNP